MKRVIYIICMMAVGILQSGAQNLRGLFEDDRYQTQLEYAKQLNRAGHYMEAYDFLRGLHQNIMQTISEKDLTAATLPDTKDFIFYQNVVISEAECAYKVNLLKEMESVCSEHVNAINDRYENGLGQNSKYYWQVASFYKTRGDYHYLRGAKDSAFYSTASEDYANAIYFYREAEGKEGQNNSREISIVYADLAQLEYARSHYDKALEYIEQALGRNTSRRYAGSNAEVSFADAEAQSLDVTLTSALAMCQARTYSFRRALRTIDDAISKLHKNDKRLPELKRARAKILLLQHEALGTDIEDASELYMTYFKAIKDTVADNFLQMSADQREEYWMLQRPFVADCYLLEERNPELLYDVTLYNKGMLLQISRSFDNLLYDGTVRGKSNERQLLNQLRQQDAQNALDGKLTHLAEEYEKYILRTMKADGRSRKFYASLNHTWRDVQKALPADGCAIEFVQYEKQGSMHSGALVLRKTGTPQFVHIYDSGMLADYYPGDWIFSLKTLLESTDGSSKNDIYEDEAIKSTIWNSELLSAIGDSRKIYFSPDGYLHQLAIEYMLPESLHDRSLYRLSSTRVLAEGKRLDDNRVRNGAAFVLGGIFYDTGYDKPSAEDPGNDVKAFQTLKERHSSFTYMKGAKVECDSIVYYRANPNDLYLEGAYATEHEFYANCSIYPILHLSTHGCFCGDMTIRDELHSSSSKDVLSESVLALSDANSNLRNADFDAFNKDGLLSAREVARLNLENLELVTTSACQTGLGYITADGIYGMQRGFKSAGAKGMVMTLWSVNIESARIFFTTFYRYMAEGESVHKAFHHARTDLLTKTYTTKTLASKFDAGTLSSKETFVTVTKEYSQPQHSCPYILIDVYE